MSYGSKARKAKRKGLQPRAGAVGYQCPIEVERLSSKTRGGSLWVPFTKARFVMPDRGVVGRFKQR